MKVSKAMQRGLHSVGPDKTLGDIESFMEKSGLLHVVVVEEGKTLGVISDRDVKRFRSALAGTESATSHDNATLSLKAHQIMTRQVVTIRDDADIAEAMDIFHRKQIHFLPVVNKAGMNVGYIEPDHLLQTFKKIVELVSD